LFLPILVGSLDGWAVCREDLIWLLGVFNSSREIYILFSETRRCVMLYFSGVRHRVVIDLGMSIFDGGYSSSMVVELMFPSF
jgi:hypothetical protein